MKRTVLSALLGWFCLAGMADAQAPACPQDAAAAGEALLARAEALEASGPDWDAVRDDTVAYGNACTGSFETQFLAADTAWELADHAGAEASYELAAFILQTIRRIEDTWLTQDAGLGSMPPSQAFTERRNAEAGRVGLIVSHYIAPTILRAIGEGRYFTGFDGPEGACPYQYEYLAQVEARALFGEISGILADNPGDTVTFPLIPGDYRLQVLSETCAIVRGDVRLIRGAALTELAARALDNPGAPMPDGSAAPADLAETLVEAALAELAAAVDPEGDNRHLLENARALEARIKDAPERLP